jgi:hypothetical protein
LTRRCRKQENILITDAKNVARLWGYTETEAENNFDPLVSMLLGACATELEKNIRRKFILHGQG